MLKVSFASQRPDGAYALAIPAWSEDMVSERLAGFPEPARTLAARAADAQRFERELAAIAETFVDDGGMARRVLLVGLGGKRDDEAIYERVGGALTAKLLTSGETKLVIDLTMHHIGRLGSPIELTVRDGRVTRIEGGADALVKRLRELEGYGRGHCINPHIWVDIQQATTLRSACQLQATDNISVLLSHKVPRRFTGRPGIQATN